MSFSPTRLGAKKVPRPNSIPTVCHKLYRLSSLVQKFIPPCLSVSRATSPSKSRSRPTRRKYTTRVPRPPAKHQQLRQRPYPTTYFCSVDAIFTGMLGHIYWYASHIMSQGLPARSIPNHRMPKLRQDHIVQFTHGYTTSTCHSEE
jgi:hypothetical protein